MSEEREQWVDEDEYPDDDWPFSDEDDIGLIDDWDEIDEIDDYRYIDEREAF